MRRAPYLVIPALAVALAASLALAAASGVGKKLMGGRDFATNVTISFTAPKGYKIDAANGYENWRGPDFTNLDIGSSDLESGLHFDVHTASTRSVERAARDKTGKDMGGIPTEQVEAGPIGVPHIVRGRKVGVIRGFYLVRQSTKKNYQGWTDAAVAFWLGRGYPVLVADVNTTAPSADEYQRIEDMLPSVWNLRVVEEGIRGIAVEGNLAPRTITAHVSGRRIAGRATDTLGHAIVGANVTLRKPGGKPCCTAVTRATGAFTLNVPRSAGTGAFQLSVAAGGAKLTKSVKIG